jgi:hypothetical protein
VVYSRIFTAQRLHPWPESKCQLYSEFLSKGAETLLISYHPALATKTGTIFCSLTYHLSLTHRQLTYTRGTPIPISLLLESDDQQALDVLSSPVAISSRLRRTTKCHSKQDKRFGSMGWKDGVEDSQLASWWPCSEPGASTRHRRRMSGELPIPKDAKPTLAIADFSLEVRSLKISREATDADEPL